jgi:hypothetical protein
MDTNNKIIEDDEFRAFFKNEFKNFSNYKNININVVKKFEAKEDIEALRKNDKFKFVGRNMLGIRKYDDWINNLEIGNVMHLNPISTSEIMQNIGKHHEFQKDPMLKKIVLLVVSFFSVSTEIRMNLLKEIKINNNQQILDNNS